MAELAFLNLHLKPRTTDIGALFQDNRFLVTSLEGHHKDQSTLVVYDQANNETCVMIIMRNDIDNGLREANFLNFLAVSALTPGFPSFVTSFNFANSPYMGIVTTGCNRTLYTILNETSFSVSYENGVRLAYKLFALLDKVHELGYVHRCIDLRTVRGGIDWKGEFSLELNGFGYTTHMDPPPQSYGMKWAYQSLPVYDNEAYTIIDDFVSALFVILSSQGVQMFTGTTMANTIRMKHRFDRDPYGYLRDPKLFWIADIYEELRQQREAGFNRHAIWAHLVTAVEGCDPSSPIDWHFKSPQSWLVRLNTNALIVRVRGEVVVPPQ